MPENEIPPAMRVDIYLASFECLAALSANAVNMPLKISVIDELCQHILLKHGNRTGIKPHLLLKCGNARFGQNHIPDSHRGRNRLTEGVDVDHAAQRL